MQTNLESCLQYEWPCFEKEIEKLEKFRDRNKYIDEYKKKIQVYMRREF